MDPAECYRYYMALSRERSEIKYVHNLEDISFSSPLCAFTGHRPNSLPFWGENDPSCLRLRSALYEAVEQSYGDGYRDFLCGMALGVDTWAAESVLALKYLHGDVNLYAAIPYMGQAAYWKNWERDRYNDLLLLCERVFVVCDTPSRRAPIIRDAFMVDHSKRLIAVYDGRTEGGTATTVRMARKKGLDMLYVDPTDFLPTLNTPLTD